MSLHPSEIRDAAVRRLITDRMTEATTQAIAEAFHATPLGLAEEHKLSRLASLLAPAALLAAVPLIVERCAQEIDTIASDNTRDYGDTCTADDLRALLK